MNNTFELIIGLALLILGVIGAVRKRFSVSFAKQGLVSPNFTITLTESRAAVFCRIIIVEGGIIVALWLIAATGDTVLGRWLGFVAGVGVVIAFLAFAICAFFEVTEPLIDKKGKKKKRPE